MELIDLVHIGLYLVNLIILYFVLKHFLYKPASKFLRERRERVEKQLAEADARLSEAEQVKKEYEGMVAAAKTEASGIIAKAHERAEVEYQNILDKGRAAADEMKERARHDIDLQRRYAYDTMRDDIVDMSIQLAGKVLEREVSKRDNSDVIDDFFESVG